MTSTADTSDVVKTEVDGVSVTKSYAADEFPVPAIKFEIESEHDESMTVRVTEDIPESFPMDAVGFHPEYHSDQWIAYEDNRVEFTGRIDPEEPLVTVYGVRLDDEDHVEEFLTEPTIADVRSADADPESRDDEERSNPVADTTIGEIVSGDRNQVVKDMLTGEADGVPGLDAESADEATADAADESEKEDENENEEADETDHEPTAVEGAEDLELDFDDVDTEPIAVADGEDEDGVEEAPDIDLDFEEELPDPAEDAEGADDGTSEDAAAIGAEAEAAETESDDEPKITLDIDAAKASVEAEESDEHEVEEATERADDADDPSTADRTIETEPGAAGPSSEGEDESVVAALAAEIRAGTVDEDDLAALREALELEASGSERARIDHLQGRVEEVAAYASALETFLDEEGTGEELIEDVRTQLADFEAELETVTDRLEETDATVADFESDIDALGSGLDEVEDAMDDLTEDVADVREEMDGVSDEVTEVAHDLDELDDDVDGLEDDVEDLEEELSGVREDVTDIVEWRDQLGSMFTD